MQKRSLKYQKISMFENLHLNHLGLAFQLHGWGAARLRWQSKTRLVHAKALSEASGCVEG